MIRQNKVDGVKGSVSNRGGSGNSDSDPAVRLTHVNLLDLLCGADPLSRYITISINNETFYIKFNIRSL